MNTLIFAALLFIVLIIVIKTIESNQKAKSRNTNKEKSEQAKQKRLDFLNSYSSTIETINNEDIPAILKNVFIKNSFSIQESIKPNINYMALKKQGSTNWNNDILKIIIEKNNEILNDIYNISKKDTEIHLKNNYPIELLDSKIFYDYDKILRSVLVHYFIIIINNNIDNLTVNSVENLFFDFENLVVNKDDIRIKYYSFENKPTIQKTSIIEDHNIIKCPNCKSTQISANKKGFSTGKAAVGVLLTGGIGLAGGLIGSNKIKITCLKCGYNWKP